MIRVVLQSLNLTSMGLKHLSLVNIMFRFLSILIGITLGGENLNGRLKCLGFWLRGMEDVGRFCRGNRFHSENLAK
jgi:hypothetical protein